MFHELRVFKTLFKKETNELIGFPKLYSSGTAGDFNYIIIELLGPSLEELFSYSNRKFSLQTVLVLLDQMV